MSSRIQTVDDPKVGHGQSEFFKPSERRQRIALIPAFISQASLDPSPELQAAAKEGKAEAIEETEALASLKDKIQQGTEKEPPRVWATNDPEPGYYFSRVDSSYVHYLENVGYYLCKRQEYEKEKRKPVCCDHSDREALLRHAVVLLVYDVDPEGELIQIQKERRVPLDDKYKMDFKYKFATWAPTDSQMREWKKHHPQFPPINSDFMIWTKKQGKTERVEFGPCQGNALWTARGPVLKDRVLKEAQKIWEGIGRTLGKDLSIQDLDVMHLGSSKSKPAAEKDFSKVLF